MCGSALANGIGVTGEANRPGCAREIDWTACWCRLQYWHGIALGYLWVGNVVVLLLLHLHLHLPLIVRHCGIRQGLSHLGSQCRIVLSCTGSDGGTSRMLTIWPIAFTNRPRSRPRSRSCLLDPVRVHDGLGPFRRGWCCRSWCFCSDRWCRRGGRYIAHRYTTRMRRVSRITPLLSRCRAMLNQTPSRSASVRPLPCLLAGVWHDRASLAIILLAMRDLRRFRSHLWYIRRTGSRPVRMIG